MNKNTLFIVYITLLVSLPLTASSQSLNNSQAILNEAIAKYEANSKGQMYKTDTLTSFTQTSRATISTYLGLFLQTGTSTNQIEMTNNSDVFSKVINTKTALIHSDTYGTTKTFVNGQQLPVSLYSQKTSRHLKGFLVESYQSTQKSYDKNTQGIVPTISKKLKARGVPPTLITKVENKLHSSQYLKLTKNETLQGLDVVLGLKPNTGIQVNTSKLENDFVGTLASILYVKKDMGSSTFSYSYAPNVWKNEFVEKVFQTRKLVVGINTDALANLAIQKKSQSSVGVGLADNISDNEFRQLVSNLYKELEIEIDIDTQTYDIRSLHIPQYEITIPYQGTTMTILFEASIKDAPTALKTITLPKKFTTPSVIRAMYLKY